MSNICGMEYLKWSAANQDRMEFYDFLTGHSDSVLTISQSDISISRPCGFSGVLTHCFHQLVGSSVLAHVPAVYSPNMTYSPPQGPGRVLLIFTVVCLPEMPCLPEMCFRCTNPCFQW